MSTQCIVVFGTVSLQKYVFQSNHLKENIGASYLVKYWLKKGLIQSIHHAGLTVNTDCWNKYQQFIPESAPGLSEALSASSDVNLIYVGGGNAALLCNNRDVAQQAVSAWSRQLLKEAPALRVAVGYGNVNTKLAEAYRTALNDMSFCEEALPFGSPFCTLPIVRPCTTTGLPASVLGKEDKQWISLSAGNKRDAVGSKRIPGPAQDSIADEFPKVLEETGDLPAQRFAIELDEELGGRKGASHIAIVHADGNGMGERLNRVVDEENQGDAEFLHNLRAFSASTTDLSHRVLEATLLHLKSVLPLDSLHNPKEIFPLRPIVYGGDDLTFVCDGRVGLHLAAFYLSEFSTGKIKVSGKDESVDACAGVAIVPTKFPFARAYDFADDLCRLAKRYRREEANSNGSWLDFQIIQEGATRSITSLREIEYRSLEGQKLHQRPYQVPEMWNNFVSILNGFRSSGWPRSRSKNLLYALTQGPTATKRFVEGAQWRNMELPSSGVGGDVRRTGWTGGDPATTPYFDPLEILDFWIEVKPETSSGDNEKESKE